ncbi:glutathione S-transferase family protein [Marinicella sp. S1101]|uniref:glutathione S-transferase family protein n=1 Tax=Marinicella marina TaxID=2996016 RepID=UPI002260CFF7|nr:glutathione S-transferase family protein [Marinicella marina]MCX7555069.1 glutathione S-transferase family protein [Marinicella marina]MDJ1141377.1 glutathione S-transferase family protein [Marinicella marina]
MGLLVDGKWQDQWYDTDANGGKFKRETSKFRHFVTADGSAGPTGDAGFKAAAGRYHLYVSLACPWAHRTLIFRKLKGLEDLIDVSVVDYLMQENGWTFQVSDAEDEDLIGDKLNQRDLMHQVYTTANDTYTGRVTVPVLWDKQQQTIVSNESADIIRMFNSAFNDLTDNHDDYYPEALHADIDAINERVYNDINNGVYKAGFATKQQVYQENVVSLFIALDWVEGLLKHKRYLTGDQITEADWRLFTTLVRFDAVYVGHFKCNLKRIADYPNISGYMRELYQIKGVAETVNIRHIKKHYYMSHETINPTALVPHGPELDFDLPHDRDK